MPITFSSFGDIVAVLQLAWQLRAALSEATGAPAEIRDLIIDIDSFTRALQEIKASIPQRRTTLQPAVENGITHAIIACHHVLTLALNKVATFKSRMTRKVGAVAWRQYWTVAAWSILGGKKDVDALRLRLSEQLNVIQTYLALSQSNDQAALQDAVHRQGTTLERVYGVVQDIQLRFDVGVPTFQFYNDRTGQYYHPFARTSLRRFVQLYEACGVDHVAEIYDDPVVHPLKLLQQIDAKASQHVVTYWFPAPQKYGVMRAEYVNKIQCCFFKERAFGEWQLLLGINTFEERHDMIAVIKRLVERKHPPHTLCDCDAGPRCRDQFKDTFNLAQSWLPLRDAYILLSPIITLGNNMDEDASRGHRDTCRAIENELKRRPDPTHIKRDILPLQTLYVEHQRPSLRTILARLREVPTAVALAPAGFNGYTFPHIFSRWIEDTSSADRVFRVPYSSTWFFMDLL